MATVPLASLLTFPTDWQRRAGEHQAATRAASRAPLPGNQSSEARTSLFPPDAHVLVTTTYPAPAAFAPQYYARQALRAGHAVVWLACAGCGEAHIRRAMRSVLGRHGRENGNGTRRASTKASTEAAPLVYIDALDSLLSMPASQSSTDDARPALLRLQHRLSQAVAHLSRPGQASSRKSSHSAKAISSDDENDAHTSSQTSRTQRRHVTVIIDDASALAWSITHLSALVKEEESSKSAADAQDLERKGEDPRIRLLRDKRRQGAEAIHRDEIGHYIATYIEEMRAVSCRPYGATLVTHLSVDNTSVTPPAARTPATRGGKYGVGTGFDADDAGEEDEEEELYEDVEPDAFEDKTDARHDRADDLKADGAAGDSSKTIATSRPSSGVAASSIDWRIDSLLRQLLPDADIWIEYRGLRSGRARDCHGELCVYGLARPCLARGKPLPHLPMPGDPLMALRVHDRSATPLKTLSQLSLRAGLVDSPSAGAADIPFAANKSSAAPPTNAPLRAFAMSSLCEGRDAAMLFRIEPTGEASAWSRGASRVTTVS